MPDTASTAEAGQAARSAPGRRSSRSQSPDQLRTLAQFMGARSYQARGEVDDERMTRSFHLPVGLIERARAASTGVEHRAYGTPIGEEVPNSFSSFVAEAIAAACTYYEDLFNGGEEFPRTGRLSPGPTRDGAIRGAQKRKAAAAAKAQEETP
jgi:hypothetical protein